MGLMATRPPVRALLSSGLHFPRGGRDRSLRRLGLGRVLRRRRLRRRGPPLELRSLDGGRLGAPLLFARRALRRRLRGLAALLEAACRLREPPRDLAPLLLALRRRRLRRGRSPARRIDLRRRRRFYLVYLSRDRLDRRFGRSGVPALERLPRLLRRGPCGGCSLIGRISRWELRRKKAEKSGVTLPK